MDCWCGGDLAGYRLHRGRRVKTEPCPASRAANTAYQRDYKRRNRDRINRYNREHVNGWKVGSEIELPDDDEL